MMTLIIGVLLIIILGGMIEKSIPNDWKYTFGFLIATICCTFIDLIK